MSERPPTDAPGKTGIRDRIKRRAPRMYGLWVLVRVTLSLAARGQFRYARLFVREYFTGIRPLLINEDHVCSAVRRALALTGASQFHLIDVGASDGLFVDALSQCVTLTAATCYEPLPDAWPPVRVGRATGRCRFRTAAVGSRPGEVSISRVAHPGLSSVLQLDPSYQYRFDTYKRIEAVEVRPVEMVTLDQDTDPTIREPIVLKIDTQGYELEVLKGAARLLGSGRVAAVVLEVMVKGKYEAQSMLEDIVAYLRVIDFEVYDILRGYREATGQVSEYDLVFCNRRLLAPKPAGSGRLSATEGAAC